MHYNKYDIIMIKGYKTTRYQIKTLSLLVYMTAIDSVSFRISGKYL